MSLVMKKLADASYEDLLSFAQTVKGLDVKRGISTTNLIAKIEAVEPGIEEILCSATPVVQQATAGPDQTLAQHQADQAVEVDPEGVSYRSDPRVKILIPFEEHKVGGKDSVKVCVNGVQFVINRDVEVDVPFRVYLVLKEAYESHYEPTYPNGPTERCVLVERRVLAYPFQLMGGLPSRDEIIAWHERTKDVGYGADPKPVHTPGLAVPTFA